ncbi:MAG: DMT family transporter [Rhodospirillaceae bacterium]|nr:DMT family transporter [Rhodospirillaceae bacterium]
MAAPTGTKNGAGLVVLGMPCLLWGLNWPMLGIALAEVDAWTLRALTVIPAGLVLLTIVRIQGHSQAVPRNLLVPLALAAALNITVFQISLAYGIQLMNSGRAVIVVYTMPLWAMLFAVWFLGERLTALRGTALMLGLAGMVVLLSQDLSAMRNAPLGVALCLLSAIAFAGGTVTIRRYDWQLPVALIAGWQLVLGGIPVTLGATATLPHVPWASISTEAWLSILYGLVLAQIVPYFLWFKAVQSYPAMLSGLATLSIPVIGVFSGALMLDDPLGWRELLALSVVCGALLLVLLEPKLHRSS